MPKRARSSPITTVTSVTALVVVFMACASWAQAPSSGRTPAHATTGVPQRAPAQAVEIRDTPTGPNTVLVEPPPAPVEAAQPTDHPASAPPETSAFDPEKKWLISAILSPFDMWVPLKYGFSVTYIANELIDYEFEYVRGTYGFDFLGEDLGEVTEQRAQLLTRVFPNETFNYFAGVNYDYTEVELHPNFTQTVSATSTSDDFTIVELGTLGVTLGLGHRWRTTTGIEIGVDWIQLQMPLLRLVQYSPFIDLSNDADKSDSVAETVRRVRDNPRFTALKFQAGISF